MKTQPQSDSPADLIDSHHLRHSAELKSLNQQHAFVLETLPESSGGFFLKFRTLFLKKLLGKFFSQHHQFNAQLTRMFNSVVAHIDVEVDDKGRRACAQLSKRIDRLGDDLDAQSLSSSPDLIAKIELIERRLDSLESSASHTSTEIGVLQTVSAGLERIIRQLSDKPTRLNQETLSTVPILPAEVPDLDYVLFENRYRGSESLISERLKVYLPFFSGLKLPVLEIGSGRGELLCLFREKGIVAKGIDIDPGMVQYSSDQGLAIECADALDYLRKQPEHSLGGVIATQVIEHLDLPYLKAFLELCCSRISPGGPVVLETINPRSIVALTQHYFRDPTHVSPLHPDTMQYLMESAGLAEIEANTINPFPSQALIPPLQMDSCLTPSQKDLLDQIEARFQAINQLLYGHQDYFIKGISPK